MKFKSQICTSVEQSQHLLDLGLKPETADMKHFFDNRNDYSFFHHWECIPYEWDKEFLVDSENIPAWSLHRLVCLYGRDYTIKELYNNAEECYGMLISAIEVAIENEEFNKKYLDR